MVQVPQQNWSALARSAAQGDAAWLRGLTPHERFALYQDLFDMICGAHSRPGDWEKLERWRWRQKLAARLDSLTAFRKRDELLRARAATDNAG